jgi:PucR family transcriptional regulator, purine catabolism regulatory protein
MALVQSKAVVWDAREGVAALVSLSSDQGFEQQLAILVGKISEEMQRHSFLSRMMLGVSEVWPKPQNILTPYNQARESLGVGALIHPDEFVHHWKKLGVVRLLLHIDSDQAEKFIEDHLGPLLNLRTFNQMGLLQTLYEILSTNSDSHAASNLHYHRKTIAYRKERLEEILQADFNDPLTRTDLLVALRLHQIHHQKTTELYKIH